jgi:hypothetical protein
MEAERFRPPVLIAGATDRVTAMNEVHPAFTDGSRRDAATARRI